MNSISSTNNQRKSKRGWREKNMQLITSSSHQMMQRKAKCKERSWSTGLISPHQQDIICENKSLRHKTKGEVEGPTKWQDQRVERWHDKMMRKEWCNLGNKKLITMRLAEQGKLQAKKKGPSRVIYHLPCGVITLQWRR
jgi:hypothetical protein